MRDDESAVTVWGLIDAQLVTFPVVAEQLNAALLTFKVGREAAEACLATDAFDVVEQDGAVDVILALFEYVRGDWAPCNSIDVVFPVRRAGDPGGRIGLYMCPTVVSHAFNSEAAYWSMGVSRALGEVTVVADDDTVTFRAADPGHAPTTFRLPRGDDVSARQQWRTQAYTCIGGRAYAVPFELELPSEPLDTAAVAIELGTGPLADRLRSFGLPAQPTFAGWAESLTGRFHPGRELTTRASDTRPSTDGRSRQGLGRWPPGRKRRRPVHPRRS